MKISRLLENNEGGGKTSTVKHTFEMQKGTNKISTQVHVTVTATSDDEAHTIAAEQMKKIMSYMRSSDHPQFSSSKSSDDVTPHKVEPTSPAVEQEEEQPDPDSDTRKYWRSKGFGEGSTNGKRLSQMTSDDFDQMIAKR